jgi:hypothetical protein
LLDLICCTQYLTNGAFTHYHPLSVHYVENFIY